MPNPSIPTPDPATPTMGRIQQSLAPAPADAPAETISAAPGLGRIQSASSSKVTSPTDSPVVKGRIEATMADQPAEPSLVDKAKTAIGKYADDSAKTVLDTGNAILHPIDTIKKLPGVFEKPYMEGINEAGDGFGGAFIDKGIANKVADVAKGISGTAKAIFSPITGLFNLAGHVPGLKQVADVANLPFTATGFAGSFATGKAIDWIPESILSKQSKDILKAPLQELGALAGQVFLGGKILEKISAAAPDGPIDPEKAQSIVDEAKAEVQAEKPEVAPEHAIKPETGTPAPEEAPKTAPGDVSQETPAVESTQKPGESTQISTESAPKPAPAAESGLSKPTIPALQDEIKHSEAFDLTDAIKNGDVKEEQIYSDSASKTLTPEFAQGRIDDVAEKLDTYDKAIGDKFRASVDPKNTTYQNIVDMGLKTLAQETAPSKVNVDENSISRVSKILNVNDLPKELKPYAKNTVENTSGNTAVLANLPTDLFKNDKFETLNQPKKAFKPGSQITDPIEVSYDVATKKYTITDGANRTTQALVNGDKTIPAQVDIIDSKNGYESVLDKPDVPPTDPEALKTFIEARKNPGESAMDVATRLGVKNEYKDALGIGTGEALKATKEKIAPEEVKPKIESKAPEAGQKQSKIGKSIEAKAVESKLSQGFKTTAGYDPITIKGQADMATDLVNNHFEDARAIIKGQMPLPEGLKGTSVITAMEQYIKENPTADPLLAEELANSHLVSATSAAAQEMRLMQERTPDSATAKLQEIRKAKMDEAGGEQKVAQTKKKLVDSAKAETKKVNLPKEELSWNHFLDQIVC